MFADVPQTVVLKVATQTVFRAEVRVWRRNLPKARAFSIRCYFTDVRGPKNRRVGSPTSCTFRVWRHRDHTGLLRHVAIAVTVVPRVPDATFEDGSGWAKLRMQPVDRAKRSLYLNPGAPA